MGFRLQLDNDDDVDLTDLSGNEVLDMLEQLAALQHLRLTSYRASEGLLIGADLEWLQRQAEILVTLLVEARRKGVLNG